MWSRACKQWARCLSIKTFSHSLAEQRAAGGCLRALLPTWDTNRYARVADQKQHPTRSVTLPNNWTKPLKPVKQSLCNRREIWPTLEARNTTRALRFREHNMAESRNVFISHIHEDDHRLAPLRALLTNAGMEVRDGSIHSDKPNNAKSPDYIKFGILSPR